MWYTDTILPATTKLKNDALILLNLLQNVVDVLSLSDRTAIPAGLFTGFILAFFYELFLPILEFDLKSLIVFLTVPSLAGFITGALDKHDALENGFLIGVFSGVVNVLLALMRTIPTKGTVSYSFLSSFGVFMLISIFTWGFIGAAAAVLARQSALPTVSVPAMKPLEEKSCSSCGTRNPAEALFCYYCGKKL